MQRIFSIQKVEVMHIVKDLKQARNYKATRRTYMGLNGG